MCSRLFYLISSLLVLSSLSFTISDTTADYTPADYNSGYTILTCAMMTLISAGAGLSCTLVDGVLTLTVGKKEVFKHIDLGKNEERKLWLDWNGNYQVCASYKQILMVKADGYIEALCQYSYLDFNDEPRFSPVNYCCSFKMETLNIWRNARIKSIDPGYIEKGWTTYNSSQGYELCKPATLLFESKCPRSGEGNIRECVDLKDNANRACGMY